MRFKGVIAFTPYNHKRKIDILVKNLHVTGQT
ncbi:unnamed protein product, partial [marine sediment metagenome]